MHIAFKKNGSDAADVSASLRPPLSLVSDDAATSLPFSSCLLLADASAEITEHFLSVFRSFSISFVGRGGKGGLPSGGGGGGGKGILRPLARFCVSSRSNPGTFPQAQKSVRRVNHYVPEKT